MSKDNKIKIKKGDQTLEVFEKAYEVVYKSAGFHPVDEDTGGNGEGDGNGNHDDFDLADLSEEDLKKINNDHLKAYLDSNEVDYKSSANKTELIALIKGEDTDGNGEGDE